MAQETLRENKMGTMPENRLLLSMAVPMMISMLVQALYNIVDSIFVSRICEDALTAVSMAFPLQNIIISIAVGFGVGINALLSRALGQKNAERVNQVAVNGLLLALLSYLLVLVAGLVGIRAYMRAQTDIESIVEYGITYLNFCPAIFGYARQRQQKPPFEVVFAAVSCLNGKLHNFLAARRAVEHLALTCAQPVLIRVEFAADGNDSGIGRNSLPSFPTGDC